jgi:chromosome segregation protein
VFLRQLTLRGFKSFADKTVLEFTPGVAVVVGPNGSGKSNVVDAISWVLGEQGPRSLRGNQMTDVIFAGSPARPQLGMAEVKLVIDNSAGLIQVPAAEIEISRTIFRSGESEYRLGGRPCRLLDIQEVLSDAGIGRALHAIVGQGRLDEILQARPEDRRQFIEEAAGIAKHRRRRERSERKLASIEQDVLRLNDVVAELRRQLKPLEKQAELAAKHEDLTREAGELAAGLAAVRLRELYRDRERRRPSWAEAEAMQAAARERLDELGREIEDVEKMLADREAAEREAEAAHTSAQARKSEAEAELREAIRDEAQARERLATASNGAGRLFTLQDELRRSEVAMGEAAESLTEREAALEAAEREFRQLDEARRDAEDARRVAEGERAARVAQADALRRSLSLQQAEQQHLAETLQDVAVRMEAAELRAESRAVQIERLDAEGTPLAEEQATLDRRRQELATGAAELEASEQALVARQDAVDARIEEAKESPGAAFARARGDRPLGLLRDLIGAPADLQRAVLAALGPFADAVVYGTHAEAVAEAAEDRGGGVLLAVADGESARFSVPGRACLLDLVKPDRRVRGLAGTLLADCYLVDDTAEAADAQARHPHAQFVTREGVVVGATFVRTPARHEARVDKLLRESAGLERELGDVRRRLRESRQELVQVTGRLDLVRRGLQQVDDGITAAAEEAAEIKAEIASLAKEKELIGERLRSLLSTASRARAELLEEPETAEAPAMPPRPEPPIHLRVEVESLRRERSRLEAAVARMRREVEELQADDPIALRGTLSELETERAARETRLDAAETEATATAETHRLAVEAARETRERDADVNRAWREQAAAVDRIRESHEDEERVRLDLERRVVEAERLLREGHGKDPEAAVGELADDATVESLQRRADLVARRLEMVGRVNLLAVDELGSLRERYEFMTRELDDVRAARRDLMEVIRDVDRQMIELFDAAFQDVAREFAELFGTLFPGGEGRLVLDDPADLLNTGIEIEARPGRKRVKRLSLLSGGERSMAAIAFLFAIFKARPSPFYLMDEVEPALDDVNLVRFLEALGHLSRTSQVIIVTHQKRTMELADVLYGMSMSKDGTTKVVAQRLGEPTPAAPDAAADPAPTEADAPAAEPAPASGPS